MDNIKTDDFKTALDVNVNMLNQAYNKNDMAGVCSSAESIVKLSYLLQICGTEHKQEYTSKDTSIHTINKVYKKYMFKNHSVILDWGGGKYDANKEYMEEMGHRLYVYDKFNRTEEHNASVLCKMDEEYPDYVVCSNVLNVIKEDEVIEDLLKAISRYKSAKVLFAIYEGDGSRKGKETSKGWQRNEKTKDYIEMISKYFWIDKISNQIIECIPL